MVWIAGTYSRTSGASGWANDAAANIGIQAGLHDNAENEVTTGINTCLTKDGQNSATANLSMGGFAHTNVAAATLRTQYAQVAQVQNSAFNWCGLTGGSANAQTLTPSPAILSGLGGQRFSFQAGFTNTGSMTLNASGLGAQTVYRPDGRVLIAGDITVGQVYTVINDGASRYICVNVTPKWNDWVPGSITGFSANPTNSVYRAIVFGNMCTCVIRNGGLGTSNTTGFTISSPYTAAIVTNGDWETKAGSAFNNTAYTADVSISIQSAGTSFIMSLANNSGGWTAAGGKGVNGIITYEI